MSAVGDRVAAAIQRHRAAIDASQNTAQEIADNRTKKVHPDVVSDPNPPPRPDAPTYERN